MDHFWTLVVLLLSGTVLVILLILAFYMMPKLIAIKRRRSATKYLLTKTRNIYFYGVPVAFCLESDVVNELRRRNVGDFAQPVGKLVICALSNLPNDSVLYVRKKNEKANSDGHHEAVVNFFYRKQWWELDLSRGLDDNVRLVRHGDKKNHRTYELISFWRLGRAERSRLEKCYNQENSNLEPDARYFIIDDDELYQKFVQAEVRHIIGQKVALQWRQ